MLFELAIEFVTQGRKMRVIHADTRLMILADNGKTIAAASGLGQIGGDFETERIPPLVEAILALLL